MHLSAKKKEQKKKKILPLRRIHNNTLLVLSSCRILRICLELFPIDFSAHALVAGIVCVFHGGDDLLGKFLTYIDEHLHDK